MARIRTIKPETWSNEQFVDCSLAARLLFIGLMNFADDHGVTKFRARTIKSNVFPEDEGITSHTIIGLVSELVRNGLVGIYEAGGVEYIHILTFNKHQKIQKPSYKHPDPPKNPAGYKDWSPTDIEPVADLFPDQSQNHSATIYPRNGREWNGREGNGREGIAVCDQSPTADAEDPISPKTNETIELGKQILKAIGYDESSVQHFGPVNAWIRNGWTAPEILAAVKALGPRLPPDLKNPLAYLAKAMPDEITKARNAAGGDGGALIMWKVRCIAFKQNGHWLPATWGPKPGEQGCEAPHEALAAADLDMPVSPPELRKAN